MVSFETLEILFVDLENFLKKSFFERNRFLSSSCFVVLLIFSVNYFIENREINRLG